MAATRIFPIAAAVLLAGVAAARAETIEVRIVDMAFVPAQVNAKVGDTVEWRNDDPYAHTATAKGQWDVAVAPKKTGETVLQQAGTFDYLCRYHPNMKGRITVTAP